MLKKKFNSYNDLLHAIEQVEIEQKELQFNLTAELKYFRDSLNPTSIVKNTFNELSSDKNLKQTIVRAGLTTASNLAIDAVLGKRKSIKGFLSAILVETVSTMLINSKATSYIANMVQLIRGKNSKV